MGEARRRRRLGLPSLGPPEPPPVLFWVSRALADEIEPARGRLNALRATQAKPAVSQRELLGGLLREGLTRLVADLDAQERRDRRVLLPSELASRA